MKTATGTVNVLVVRQDATAVSFQSDSWIDATRDVVRFSRDRFYRMSKNDHVFMAVVGGSALCQYTVGEMVRAEDHREACDARQREASANTRLRCTGRAAAEQLQPCGDCQNMTEREAEIHFEQFGHDCEVR